MAVEGHLHPYPPVGTDRLQSAESSQRADLRITAAVDPMLPMRCTCLPPMSVVVPLGTPPLASGTGNPVLCLGLDRPARVGEAAPHLLAHGAAYLLRQCG